MNKNRQKKVIGVRENQLPADYPFGDLLEESICWPGSSTGSKIHSNQENPVVNFWPINKWTQC